MVTYEYKGVVEVKGETMVVGQKGFQKRELVLGNPPDVPSNYPNPVLFTFKKDRCALLDPINVGDLVKIQFTIDGRRWDGPNGTRYFTDLTGWKIEVMNGDGSTVESMTYGSGATRAGTNLVGGGANLVGGGAQPPPPPPPTEELIDDDIPF